MHSTLQAAKGLSALCLTRPYTCEADRTDGSLHLQGCVMTCLASDLAPLLSFPPPATFQAQCHRPTRCGSREISRAAAPMEGRGRKDRNRRQAYPTTARALLMDGEEGGVAMASRLGPELEGGDVEGTVRLTTGESSPSPASGTDRHSWAGEAVPTLWCQGVEAPPSRLQPAPHSAPATASLRGSSSALAWDPLSLRLLACLNRKETARHHPHPVEAKGPQAHL